MSRRTGAPRGRPTKYTRALGTEICERLAGGESLRSICSDGSGKPTIGNVLKWVVSDSPIYADFQKQYARAREVQKQLFIDEIADIADDGSNDWMDRQTKNGTIRVLDHEHVQRSKLRIEARQWSIGRMEAKRPEADPAPQQIVFEIDEKPTRKAG